MRFSRLSAIHRKTIQSMVAPDRFSSGTSHLDLHARDQSHHAARRPEAVIWPVHWTEVSDILKYADRHRIPVTAWGAGTSLEGNPIPVKGGIVLDFSRMNKILDIREKDFQADVQPGVIYQDLNEALRYTGLFFPPDPGARATVGGMIANNASGTRTVYYGSTKDHVLRLVVVLPNGERIKIGARTSKSSSGYDLIHLFTGSEGTLGIVVEATLRLVGRPAAFSAAIASFPSVAHAGKAVYGMIRYGLEPAALELMGPECIDLFNREKDLGLAVRPTLFMEFHGPSEGQLEEIMEMARMICQDAGCGEFRAGLGKPERNRLFEARHQLGEMIIRNHPDCGILIIDVAVPITAYPEMIAKAGDEIDKTGLVGYTFSHAGDGNLHLNLVGKRGDEKAWKQIHQVADRMVSRALELGGTATGEHGVGIGKKKFMAAEHSNSLQWMRKIKRLFDPNGILNPDKIFPPS